MADPRYAMSVQWDEDAHVTHDVIAHLFDIAGDIDRSIFVGITDSSMLIIAPVDAHGGVVLLERVLMLCLGALQDMRPNLQPYGQQYFLVCPTARPHIVASRGQRRRCVLFQDDDEDESREPDPSAGLSARRWLGDADPSAGSSAGTAAGSSAGTIAGSSAGIDAGPSDITSERPPMPMRPVPGSSAGATAVDKHVPPPPTTPPPTYTQVLSRKLPSAQRRTASVPPPARLPASMMEPMAICRLIEATPNVTFLRTYIAANECTDCIYFQWRAEAVVGVRLLEGCEIDMQITLMYMHVEPRWREALAGMQQQWSCFTKETGAGSSAPHTSAKADINHTESSWILSEYSDERIAMLKLKVGSRLYSSLLQTVANGVQKLPVQSRPEQWRFRHELHLSVRPSRQW